MHPNHPIMAFFAGGVSLPLSASQTEVFRSLGSLHHPCTFHNLEPAGSPGFEVQKLNKNWTSVASRLASFLQKTITWVLSLATKPHYLSAGPIIRLKEEASDFFSTARQPTPPALEGTRLASAANLHVLVSSHNSIEMYLVTIPSRCLLVSESGVWPGLISLHWTGGFSHSCQANIS